MNASMNVDNISDGWIIAMAAAVLLVYARFFYVLLRDYVHPDSIERD